MITTDIRPGHLRLGDHRSGAGSEQDTPQAIEGSTPDRHPPAGDKSATGQKYSETHVGVAGGSNSLDGHRGPEAQGESAVGGQDGSPATKLPATTTHGSSLADPSLALAADVLDDTERTRIANENRLRQLTRTGTDSDGEERGFGLDESHPDVARLAALVNMLAQVEHQATLNLQRKLREHPLGAWCKAQRGIGEKQAARLLAVIGDPYWNTLHNRSRTVSELWAYSGYHTLPAGHMQRDAQGTVAGGAQATGGDQCPPDTQTGNVAARRKKGERANWSTLAKTRAYLIAESCMKAGGPYREIYDKRKANTEGREHVVACVRCGPSGKPAQPGSPWSDGHRHADALRITAKAILRDLWREAKRIYEQGPATNHPTTIPVAPGPQNSPPATADTTSRSHPQAGP